MNVQLGIDDFLHALLQLADIVGGNLLTVGRVFAHGALFLGERLVFRQIYIVAVRDWYVDDDAAVGPQVVGCLA